MLNTDHPLLAEARRIAEQPVGDRLDGKQGEEAREVLIRLAEAIGLDFMDAIRLVETYGWHQHNDGFNSARSVYFPTKEQ